MPSKPFATNSFKASNPEMNMSMGDNSMRRDLNKNNKHDVFVGSINSEASREDLLNFFSDLRISSLMLFKRKLSYAFIEFSDLAEAEKAIQLYNNKVFMGRNLNLRFAHDQPQKPGNLPQMPELEDYDDCNDGASNCDEKYCNSSVNSADNISPVKNSFEDSLNIQPDSNGLFSLCINKKDSYLRSESVIENIFSKFGSVSSVSFTDEKILVKVPSKQQAINSFKAWSQELSLSIGHNPADINTRERTRNKSFDANLDLPKIYIGNINVKATQTSLLQYFGDVKINSLKLCSRGNKVFAFAHFPDIEEAQKAIELYNQTVFLGSRLILRLNDDRAKKGGNLPQMLKLEDIGDDNCSDGDSYCEEKFSSRKMIPPASVQQFEDTNIKRKTSNKSWQPQHSKENNRSEQNRKSVNEWMGSHDNSRQNGGLSVNHQEHRVTLFVGNFPVGMSEDQLFSLFQEFQALSINIINNQNPKRSTQALIDFPNHEQSERAILKYDRASYKSSTLLVTSTGSCPCDENQKSSGRNGVPSPNHSGPTMEYSNGSNSFDQNPPGAFQRRKGQQQRQQQRQQHQPHQEEQHQPQRGQPQHRQPQQSPQKQHRTQPQQQQQRRNSEPPNSSSRVSPKEKTSTKPPRTNSPREKKSPEQNRPVEEINHQLNNCQIDDVHKSESTKMKILVKNFHLHLSFGSPSDIHQVMITSVVSDELFWGNVFSSSTEELADFMVLHSELQSTAMTWPKYILSKKEMKCVALFQGEWYRAWVLNVVEKDVVEVFFLDYGNISQIHLNDVRSSNDSIWKIQPKARAFRLDNDSQKLPPNAENQIFGVKVCKTGIFANGFISIASLVPQ